MATTMSMINTTLTSAQVAYCETEVRSDYLLSLIGIRSTEELLLAQWIGASVQSLVTGSCLQLLHHYFTQPKRDSTWTRIGILTIGIGVVGQVIISYVAGIRMIVYQDVFITAELSDWWLIHLSQLILSITVSIILVFFSLRAYHIWDRNRYVLITCLAIACITFGTGVAGSASGLLTPWGWRPLTMDEFQSYLPTMVYLYKKFLMVEIMGVVGLLVTSTAVSVFILVGVLRHWSEFRQMNTAIAKIVYICSESLIPYVVLSSCLIAGTVGQNFKAFQMLRVVNQLAAPVFYHGLLNSLVARERVQEVLKAQPVRHLTSFKYAATSDDKLPDSYALSTAPSASNRALLDINILDAHGNSCCVHNGRGHQHGGTGTQRRTGRETPSSLSPSDLVEVDDDDEACSITLHGADGHKGISGSNESPTSSSTGGAGPQTGSLAVPIPVSYPLQPPSTYAPPSLSRPSSQRSIRRWGHGSSTDLEAHGQPAPSQISTWPIDTRRPSSYTFMDMLAIETPPQHRRGSSVELRDILARGPDA